MSWNNHVTYIYKPANSRLHFLWQLKRAAVQCKDILRFYIAVISPEYAASCLTAEVESLELVQKRAFRIIFGGSSFPNSNYLSFCKSPVISPLQSIREILYINFFHKFLESPGCLCCLIPTKRSNSQLKILRNHLLYSPPFTRTKSLNKNALTENKPPPIRMIQILDLGLPDPQRDPDRHQNCITWSLSHALPLQKISSKSVHKFASNPMDRQTDRQTNRQTDRQTDRTKNITSFCRRR